MTTPRLLDATQTSYDRSLSLLEKLRCATKPRAIRFLPKKWKYAILAAKIVLPVLVGFLTFNVHVLLFVLFVASYLSGIFLANGEPLFYSDNPVRKFAVHSYPAVWLSPIATGVSTGILMAGGSPAVFLSPFIGFTLAWLWQISPWFVPMVKHGCALAGWNSASALYTRFVKHDHESLSSRLLLCNTDPTAYSEVRSEVQSQLESLQPEWEINDGLGVFTNIVVGSGGVVGVAVADLQDREAVGTGAVLDEQSDIDLLKGFTAVREIYGNLVQDSDTFELAKTLPDNTMEEHEWRDASISNMQVQLMVNAMLVDSELELTHGERFESLLPSMVVHSANILAAKLGMPGTQAPTILMVAHGLKMDRKWGRVSLHDLNGCWAGSVIVCHPDHVAECLESLPGVFNSFDAVRGAQHATELLLR